MNRGSPWKKQNDGYLLDRRGAKVNKMPQQNASAVVSFLSTTGQPAVRCKVVVLLLIEPTHENCYLSHGRQSKIQTSLNICTCTQSGRGCWPASTLHPRH